MSDTFGGVHSGIDRQNGDEHDMDMFTVARTRSPASSYVSEGHFVPSHRVSISSHRLSITPGSVQTTNVNTDSFLKFNKQLRQNTEIDKTGRVRKNAKGTICMFVSFVLFIIILIVAILCAVLLTVGKEDAAKESEPVEWEIDGSEDIVDSIVRVFVTISNWDYTADLTNHSSTNFKAREKALCQQVQVTYRNSELSQYYQSCEVMGFRTGSVKGELTVFFKDMVKREEFDNQQKAAEHLLAAMTTKKAIFGGNILPVFTDIEFAEIKVFGKYGIHMINNLPKERNETTTKDACEPIQMPTCRNLTIYNVTMPNVFAHKTQEEAAITALEYLPLFQSSNCTYEYGMLFGCYLLFPKCSSKGFVVPPCRQFCEVMYNACGHVLHDHFGIQLTRDLCAIFPTDTTDPDVCIQEPGIG